MGLLHWVSSFLVAASVAQASVLPFKNQRQNEERGIISTADAVVELVITDVITIEELAEQLTVDLLCLVAANPLLWLLEPGQTATVPYRCCRTSCQGSICSKRPGCQGQSSSAPAQPSGTSTTTLSTITTSVPATSSTASSSSSGAASPSSSSSAVASSAGSSSGGASPSSSGSVASSASNSAPSTPSSSSTVSGVVTTTNSLGQTVISDGSGAVTLPTGVSSATTVTLPDGSTVTFQPTASSSPSSASGAVTTTNSLGQIVISDGSGAVTLPTGISSATTVTLPDGSTVTFQPSTASSSPSSAKSGVVTTTNSLGQTVISDSSGAVTLPTGISSSSLVTLPDGSVVTFQPTTSSASAPGPVTTTNSNGATVISDSSGAVTLPTGISTSTLVTLPDGSVVTFQPTAGSSSSSGSSVIPGLVTTTDAAGETVISDTSGAVTLPTGISTSSVVTLPDGSVVTFVPTQAQSSSSSSSAVAGVITTTDPAGETVISSSGEGFTIPTGLTTPVTITNGDGRPFTFTPTAPPSSTSSSSTIIPVGGIFPVTTSVPQPKATDGGTEIPCNLWFFFICIQWGDLKVGGWEFNLPQGIRPPGPPPPITFPPSLHISVSISGTLPPWPAITIGPDNLPTYPPKPSDGPNNECKTESAEICLTSTSFGVDTATVTTTSSVTSTCTTVFGCEVTDSATTTASASTSSTSYAFSCTPGCSACVAKRALPTPVEESALPTVGAMKSRKVLERRKIYTLAERDIPDSNAADVPAELYDMVTGSATTTKLSLDNQGVVGLSSSRFKYFDNSEFNLLVTGLEGCTSVIVVSQLGAYVSHFWEQSFTEPGGPPNFQNDVLNYFSTGRPGDAGEGGNTEPLGALVQGGVFPSDKHNTQIFIMTPATYSLDLKDTTSRTDRDASLKNGDFQPLFDGNTPEVPFNRLAGIRGALTNLMPNVPIAQFTYRRDTNNEGGAYGKATVLYSNKQVIDPNDPIEDLPAPQKAVWQCWMQGKKMGQDIWDALPGQVSSCSANQKRQAGELCSPKSVGPSSTSVPSASGPTSASITSAPSPSPTSLSDLPKLSSTTQSTPPGQACAATATQTQCALGPNPGETACVSSTVCASFTPTTTSTTSTTSATPIATPPATVDLYIFSDSDCHNRVDVVTLTDGQCYKPANSFGCFSIENVSKNAETAGVVSAFKGEGCFSQFDSDVHDYRNLVSLLNQLQHPFTMGSLDFGMATG